MHRNDLYRITKTLLALTIALLVSGAPALAQRGGGGGGASVRSSSRSSVNGNANRNVNQNVNQNVNRNTNVNQNVNRNTNVNQNVNVNRNVNINNDIDIDVNHGYGHGGCCYNDHYHPVARAAAVVTTAAIIGSMVYSLPPSCTVVVANGISYQHCGSAWYQPQFSGTTTTYIVVNAPN